MRVYRRGETWWVYFTKRDGTEVRQSLKTKDRTRANAIARDIERRANDPTYAASNETTLADAVKRFKEAVKQRGRSKDTQEMYDTKCGHLLRLLGVDTPMTKIGAREVDDYIKARREEGAVNNTIHKELVALRGVLKVARRRGEYDKEPSQVMPVGFNTGYKPRERVLTRREVIGLMLGLPEDIAAWLAAAVATGARLSELARLERHDINIRGGEVLLRGTKTAGAFLRIPIVSATRPFLQAVLDHGRPGPRPLPTWGRVRRPLDRARQLAGLKHFSPNDLRRTFSTWLVEAGVPLELVSKLMRHRDTRMVSLVYGKPSAKALGRLVEDAMKGRTADVRHSGDEGDE
jgi:integrase